MSRNTRSGSTWDELVEAGFTCHAQGDLEGAQRIYDLANELADTTAQPEPAEQAKLCVLAGDLQLEQKHFEAAAKSYREAILKYQAIAKSALDMSIAINGLSHVYFEQGNCEEALRLKHRADELTCNCREALDRLYNPVVGAEPSKPCADGSCAFVPVLSIVCVVLSLIALLCTVFGLGICAR